MMQLIDISEETLRHWTKVLAPLQQQRNSRVGHATYSVGDAVALLVVRHLVREMGVQVAKLAAPAQDLFAICRRHLDALKESTVVLNLQEGTAAVAAAGHVPTPSILVPMRTFVERIQHALNETAEQRSLPFAADAAQDRDVVR